MAKKQIKIWVEKDTHEQIKGEVDNLSQFTDQIYRDYLSGIKKPDTMVEKEIEKQKDIITKAQVRIATLHKCLSDKNNKEKQETEKKNEYWKQIYPTKDIDLEDAMKTLCTEDDNETFIEYILSEKRYILSQLKGNDKVLVHDNWEMYKQYAKEVLYNE